MPNISTNFMFKRLKFKLLLLKDIPTINQKDKLIFKKIFQSSKYKIKKFLFEWFQILLRSTNILPKYELYFLN